MSKKDSYTGKDNHGRTVTVTFEEVTIDDMMDSIETEEKKEEGAAKPAAPRKPFFVILPKKP